MAAIITQLPKNDQRLSEVDFMRPACLQTYKMIPPTISDIQNPLGNQFQEGYLSFNFFNMLVIIIILIIAIIAPASKKNIL